MDGEATEHLIRLALAAENLGAEFERTTGLKVLVLSCRQAAIEGELFVFGFEWGTLGRRGTGISCCLCNSTDLRLTVTLSLPSLHVV